MSQSLKKILLLINLLQNRDFITFHDAHTLCGINKRTFYRYINMLSEIDIPIIYDKSVRGYRTTEKLLKRKLEFNLNELTLLIICLHFFSKHTNDYYQEDVNKLSQKLLSLINFPMEQNLNELVLNYTDKKEKKALSYYINSTMLEIASSQSFSISVTYKNNGLTHQHKLFNPRILFQHDWLIEDKSSTLKIPIDHIEHISLEKIT